MNVGGFPRVLVAALLVAAAYGCAPVRVIAIDSSAEFGAGSLREAILAANRAEEPVRIVSGLSSPVAIPVTRELPELAGRNIELDGEGIRLVGGDCVRSDGRRGCSGLVVTGSQIVVRRFEASGFVFDGISVRGGSADAVEILDSHLHGNLDDGVGISDHASGVRVVRCLLEGNGFRTKGKGVLIFDSAEATLVDNVVRGNRDGVTVSKHARAHLVRNRIVDSYDKGLGVSGAHLTGRGNEILRNGLPDPGRPPVPNGDGLRVGLVSTVMLEDTKILGNGDAAVVVLNESIVELRRATLADNRGAAVQARGNAVVRLFDVTWRDNGTPDLQIAEDARIEREPKR